MLLAIAVALLLFVGITVGAVDQNQLESANQQLEASKIVKRISTGNS